MWPGTQVFRLLEAAQLDALLVKGWAIARHYPDPGLRHYGDLDLCVRAKDYSRAAELLEGEVAKEVWIDLHQGTAMLDRGREEELFERSETGSHRRGFGACSFAGRSPENSLSALTAAWSLAPAVAL